MEQKKKKDSLEEDSRQFYSMYFNILEETPVLIKKEGKVILEVKPNGDILIKDKTVENDIDIYYALTDMINQLKTYIEENK